jgi:hypothetical protein
MKLTLTAIVIAIVAGLLAGGRLTNMDSARIRFPVLAPVGLGLQLLPVPGRVLPMALLYVSFVILFVFALVNLRRPGFALIFLGLAMNFAVIAGNGGMPVTRHALAASGQQDTLTFLIHDGGAKHHLATSSDVLLPLADVIPIGGVDQVASAGDLTAYLGIMWLIVASMRKRPVVSPETDTRYSSAEPEVVHVAR